MKLISRNTDYAVRAVCYISNKKDSVVSVKELVDNLKMPRPFLRKILQRLNSSGILRSHKGSGGGFTLAMDPAKIYLMDLMRIFQGPFKLNECYFRKKLCPNRKSCFLKKKIDSIEKYVLSELKSITIDFILNGE